jgi:hypothetical protein
MINKEYIVSNRIQELISNIYFLKIEINSNFQNLSTQQIQEISDQRIEMKKELYRLQKLRDRKNKILKIRSKI